MENSTKNIIDEELDHHDLMEKATCLVPDNFHSENKSQSKSLVSGSSHTAEVEHRQKKHWKEIILDKEVGIEVTRPDSPFTENLKEYLEDEGVVPYKDAFAEDVENAEQTEETNTKYSDKYVQTTDELIIQNGTPYMAKEFLETLFTNMNGLSEDLKQFISQNSKNLKFHCNNNYRNPIAKHPPDEWRTEMTNDFSTKPQFCGIEHDDDLNQSKIEPSFDDTDGNSGDGVVNENFQLTEVVKSIKRQLEENSRKLRCLGMELYISSRWYREHEGFKCLNCNDGLRYRKLDTFKQHFRAVHHREIPNFIKFL